MPFAENLADFINDDTPGYVKVTIGGAVIGLEVGAIFQEAYASALDFSAGTRPVLHCSSADAHSAVEGTVVVVESVRYTVAEVQPDGYGMVLLVLEKV